MKNIKIILLFILLIFSFWFNTNSIFADFWSDTFNNSNDNSIPYCQEGECWIEQWIKDLKNIQDIETDRKASVYIQDIVINVLWYLYLIWVILIIYAWFLILTSTWDEEKIKKWKNIIIFTVIWIIVIYLASPIIKFVIGKILT